MDSQLALYAEFGFSKDPFVQAERMETADALKIKRLVGMAIDSRAMVTVHGPRGFGKSDAIKKALAGRAKTIVVRLASTENEAVTIGDIEKALILDVSEVLTPVETPKRSREVRARQLRRIVGEASKSDKNYSVILILEDAQCMHAATLRSIKRLRELEYHGMDRLVTVLLTAQWDPFRSQALDEVRLRSDKIEMKGLTSSEIKEYVGHTVGRVFEDDAVEAVSRIGGPNGRGQNFLELQELLCDLMDTALMHGHKKVKAIDVFSKTGGGLKELLKEAGISQADAAREANVTAGEVSVLVNNKQSSISDARAIQTKNALLEIAAKRLKEKAVVAELPGRAVNQ
jgi:type II secretory pathway predicted ATPase ExeA/predicted XRE-type DNA-binding protein